LNPAAPIPVLTVLVPAYNEADNIAPFLARMIPALEALGRSFEIVLIDDGSSDATWARWMEASATDPRLRGLKFSRNFGKEIAIAAGLDHARGEAAILIDADLQHPPEMIADFVREWENGYDVVYGVRQDRETDSKLRKNLTQLFYKLFRTFGEIPLPEGAGDFRLMDRKVVKALRQLGERARFSKGLYAWVGFEAKGVPFVVAERAAGESKFSFRKLFRFAFDGITSFSTLPLQLWTHAGILISVPALATAIFFLVRTIASGTDVPGYASLIISVVFFSGVQLISLGVIGGYIGRIFAEVKRRPLYIVAEESGPDSEPPRRRLS
jgi:glycosyltransferase involved in cell wall biosynthesis